MLLPLQQVFIEHLLEPGPMLHMEVAHMLQTYFIFWWEWSGIKDKLDHDNSCSITEGTVLCDFLVPSNWNTSKETQELKKIFFMFRHIYFQTMPFFPISSPVGIK